MSDPFFFQLVQVAVGAREAFDSAPSAEQWEELLAMAKKQSAAGVLSRALEILPEDQLPPRDPVRLWMVERTKAVRRNALMDQRARELTERFAADGLRAVVLKGQGVGRLYPDPSLRQSGDIDLWVPGGREAVLTYLKGRVPLRRPVYHHIEAKFFEDVEVEVHYLPAFLYNPFRNRKLQAFFEERLQPGHLAGGDDLGFYYPDPAFDAVFSLVHISKHIINEGVGLRQVMDHHYIMQALSPEQQGIVRTMAERLGFVPLAEALTHVETRLFGSPGCPDLFAPASKRGERLLRDVLLSGNFGHADTRSGGLAARFFRFLSDYPSEVLWSPIWKSWHWVWRKCKGYL